MSSNYNESQARDLVKKADSKLSSFFGSLFGGNKYEDALEMYTQAANLFKMAKNFKEAGDVFKKTTSIHQQLGSPHDAAGAFINASNCYRQSGDHDACLQALELAAGIYTNMGKFSQAAKTMKDAAELFEKQENLEKAATLFQQAGDFYLGENSKSSANACFVKVAHLLASLKKYDEAILLFDKCIEGALDDKLLTWGAKEYITKSMMCKLAKMKNVDDELDSQVKCHLDNYKDLDVRFPDSRECKLLELICKAFEERDEKMFKSALKDFDQITKLTPWQTNVFLEIKKVLDDHIKNISIA
jgi:alpha-soluble NSF attachment protein